MSGKVLSKEMLNISKRSPPILVMMTSKGDAMLPSVTVPKLKSSAGDTRIVGGLLTVVLPSEHPSMLIEKNVNIMPSVNF